MIQCSISQKLCKSKYREYRSEAIFKGFKWDPQLLDSSTIGDRAILIGREDWNLIQNASSQLYKETLLIEEAVQNRIKDKSKKRFLPVRAHQFAELLANEKVSSKVRLMRFDFHPTEDGWKITEVNSDVPGGLNEASIFQTIWPDRPSSWQFLGDPANAYILSIINKFNLSDTSLVGLMHATSFSDDWQFMSFLQEIMAEKGIESIELSPENFELVPSKTKLNGRKLDVILRFFPGDWLLFSKMGKKWFENPMDNLVNPMQSIFSQNKYFPVLFEEFEEQFPNWFWYLPETKKLRLVDLLISRDLIKPSFGRVGEDIQLIPNLNLAKKFKISLQLLASTGLWIKQKKYKPMNLGTLNEPMIACVGVYCLNGEVIGAYGRVSTGSIVGITATENPIFISN